MIDPTPDFTELKYMLVGGIAFLCIMSLIVIYKAHKTRMH